MSLLSFLNGGYKPYCFIFIEITYAESSGKSAKAWLSKHELLGGGPGLSKLAEEC